MLLRDSKAPQRRLVAAKVDSYHKGYLNGIRIGARKAKVIKPVKQVRKAAIAKVFKKQALVQKVEAYQKGYHLGAQTGALRERSSAEKARQERLQAARKASNKRSYARMKALQEAAEAALTVRRKRSKAWSQRLVSTKHEAYKLGLRYGSKKERRKLAKAQRFLLEATVCAEEEQAEPPVSKKTRATKVKTSKVASSKGLALRRRLRGKQVCPWWHKVSSWWQKVSSKLQRASLRTVPVEPAPACPSFSPQAASSPLRGGADAFPSFSSPQSLPEPKSRPEPIRPLVSHLLGAPTPARQRPPTKASGSTLAQLRRARQEPNTAPLKPSRPAQAPSTPMEVPSTPTSVPSGADGADHLCEYLENPKGVTAKPAVFQLRLKQTSEVDGAAKKTVIIVGGKSSLWKLNQIIGECFNASDHEFEPKKGKGATVLGSHFKVSRPVAPGRCNEVMISSRCTAAYAGTRAFVDDRNYTVAELFRGTSTRCALHREPGDAAQRVVFSNPLLSADVSVSLDGIMLDNYDSGNVFDKSRRNGNGKLPVPRIVCSSFLGFGDLEAKNNAMQGSQKGGCLSMFDASWSAIHASYRRSEYRQLFREGGGDFGPADKRNQHVGGDEDADHDAE